MYVHGNMLQGLYKVIIIKKTEAHASRRQEHKTTAELSSDVKTLQVQFGVTCHQVCITY